MKKLLSLLLLVFLLPHPAHAALTDNLQAYYKFDESSGNAADSTANANTGTNIGTATYAPAKINNGGQTASGKYWQAADSTSLSITGDLSVAGWIKFTSDTGGTQAVFAKRDNSTTNTSYIIYFPAGLNQLHFYSSSDGTNPNSTDINVPFTALSTGTWYHIALVYTASSGSIQVWINGVSQGTASGAKTSTFDGTAPMRIGAYVDGGGSAYTNWLMDEWGIWNRTLSGTEISQLYNSGNGLSYPFTTSTGVQSIIGLVRALWIN